MKKGRTIWALTRLFILLPLWLLGLVLLLAGLVLSPWGTRMALDQGQNMGLLEYDSVQGALLDDFDLTGFRLELGGLRVSVDDLALSWAEDCVLKGRLCLDYLRVSGTDVRLGESGAPAEPVAEEPAAEPGGPLSLPFPVEIRELAVSDVTVHLADGAELYWERFTTGAVAEGDTLSVAPTRLAGLRLTLPLTPGAMLALSGAEHEGPVMIADAIDAAIAVRSPLPSEAAAQLEGLAAKPLDERPRIELPDVTLPLAVEVPELVIEDAAVDGAFEYGVERLDLSLNARGQEVTIEPLAVATVDANAELQAEVTLSGDYPLTANFAADLFLPERFPALSGERVELALAGSLAELGVDLTTSGPIETRLVAELDALDPTLPFTASFQSPRLQWPLPGMATAPEQPPGSEQEDQVPAEEQTDEQAMAEASGGEPPWVVTDIDLNASGSLMDYQTRLALTAEGPSLPPTELALEGSGDLQHYRWAPLAVTTDAGSLSTEGQVRWSDGLALDATLTLDDVNPEPFVEGLSGSLSGNAEVSFVQDGDGWRLDVPALDIAGSLDDRPLSLEARLSGDSAMRWDIETLDFRQGENRIQLTGQVSETRLDVDGELDLPAMASLYPGLAGRLSGDIKASGSLKAPQLDLALDGSGVAFGENRVGELTLAGRVAGIEDPELDIGLKARDVEAGGQRFADIALDLTGRLSQHRLELSVIGSEAGPLNKLVVALDGAMNSARDRYQGTLSPLEVELPQGRLSLDDPLSFEADLATSAVTVEPFCLRREQGGAVCSTDTLSASADKGSASLEVRELPMDLVNASLPEGWRIEGDTQASVTAGWSAGGSRWQAQAELGSEVRVTGQDAYGNAWSVPATSLSLQLDASEARIDLDVALGLADSGDLTLDLTVQDPIGAGGLDGRLTIDDVRLSPYRPLAGGIDELKGGLNGEIRIQGNREAPNLSGDITLSGLNVKGAGVPLVVTDGRVDISLNGSSADISGYIDAEEGRLNINGDAAWPGGSWEANVALSAVQDPLLASMPAFGRLKLAPDLTISANPNRLRVRGEVRIPWARLEVGKVPPSAVSPSGDEIIITREQDEEAREAERLAAEELPGESTAEAMAQAGMAIDIKIRLLLGPDMRLEAYGLETELEGDLEVRQADGPLQLFGDVNLVDGRFRAYGQDLQIREGKLVFGGPPSQPLLDFEAIRNPASTADGVVAGLRVTGLAAQPDLEIFSEPSMDESRALSYVLRGQAPEDGGSSGALTSALIGLTLGKTGGAVGSMGEAFGIQDLSLDTSGAGEDSQVVVSGKLTDRLEVGYGVGVFSPIAELTLTYQLWRSLYLEAVSGTAQAVDLIYTWSLPGNPPDLSDP
ncbi:autotransporter assembly complex protein TamB [Halomonas sp. V046]|uniref:autotransporter assembly complex protein TamB n=1 Tax=Halomonas sp. V046 TaxID=3459611 RepID=UPI00404469D9